jgi:hypothetical protein
MMISVDSTASIVVSAWGYQKKDQEQKDESERLHMLANWMDIL